MINEIEIPSKIIKIPDKYLYILYLTTFIVLTCALLSFNEGQEDLRGWTYGYILSGYICNYINSCVITSNLDKYKEYLKRSKDARNLIEMEDSNRRIADELFYKRIFKGYEDYSCQEKFIYWINIVQYSIGFNFIPEMTIFYTIDHSTDN